MEAAKKRLGLLYQQITLHSKKYYQDNQPQILDSEYDKIKKEYLELIKKFPDAGFKAFVGDQSFTICQACKNSVVKI